MSLASQITLQDRDNEVVAYIPRGLAVAFCKVVGTFQKANQKQRSCHHETVEVSAACAVAFADDTDCTDSRFGIDRMVLKHVAAAVGDAGAVGGDSVGEAGKHILGYLGDIASGGDRDGYAGFAEPVQGLFHLFGHEASVQDCAVQIEGCDSDVIL